MKKKLIKYIESLESDIEAIRERKYHTETIESDIGLIEDIIEELYEILED